MTAPAAATPDRQRIEGAVAGLVTAFQTDGYVMRVIDYDGQRLRMAITANEGACAECLVPHDMMAGLVRASLPDDLSGAAIEIAYPAK